MLKNRTIPAVALALFLPLLAWSQEKTSPPATGTLPAAGGVAPAASGLGAVAPPVDLPTDAEVLLDEAVKKIAALDSVMADILESVEMLGQKFEISGRFRKAPKDRLYLRLDVSGLPDSKGTMLQVCDGVTFWDYQQVFETQIFRKLEAGPILSKLRTADIGDDLRGQILTQMGFAGPDVLLVGLRQRIKFIQKEEGTLEGKPVWIIRGEWKSREGLLGPNSQPLPALAPLPSYIPSHVNVYLGKDDSWPYKVELVGRAPSAILEDTRPLGPDGRRIGPRSMIQKPLLSRIVLSYSDVKLNTPVPDREFVWQAPPGAQVEDETRRILDGLEQAIAMKAAQKKAEAAKNEDPLLNQTIDVPNSKGAAVEPAPSEKEHPEQPPR